MRTLSSAEAPAGFPNKNSNKPLFYLSPSHRALHALSSFSPQSPYNTKEASAEEREMRRLMWLPTVRSSLNFP